MSDHPDQALTAPPPISQWVQELLEGPTGQRQAAAAALAQVRPSPPAVVAAFVQALGDRNPLVAGPAGRALRDLGPGAVAPLLDALKDPAAERGVLKAAAHLLASLRPDSQVQRLVEELLCGDSRSQCEAAESLGGLGGREAREAVGPLAWALRKGPDVKVREAAGRALGRLGPLTPAVIPALAEVLEGAPPGAGPAAAQAVPVAAQALGRIGTPEAIEALLRALQGHRDAGVKCRVAESLGALLPPAPAAVGPLVGALNDESPAVREAAARALIAIGPGAVAELTAALRRGLPEVRRAAAAALGRLAPESGEALDALARALGDRDGPVVVHAAVAILKAFEANASVRLSRRQKREQSPGGDAPEDERALAVLIGVVRRKGGERRDRQHAAEALGRLGPAARPAVGALVKVVADESEDRLVRGSAWWALQRLAPEEAEKLKAP
jgi:HEAT repeat protein